jgi:hypothetical protein
MSTGRRSLRLIEKIDASPRNVRNFGYLFALICVLASALLAYKSSRAWPYLAAAGVLFLTGAVSGSALLKGVYRVWMTFAYVLGWVNARVLLGLFFYLVLTPVGLILRSSGKDLLDEKIDRKAHSYWIKRERRTLQRERLERLF